MHIITRNSKPYCEDHSSELGRAARFAVCRLARRIRYNVRKSTRVFPLNAEARSARLGCCTQASATAEEPTRPMKTSPRLHAFGLEIAKIISASAALAPAAAFAQPGAAPPAAVAPQAPAPVAPPAAA